MSDPNYTIDKLSKELIPILGLQPLGYHLYNPVWQAFLKNIAYLTLDPLFAYPSFSGNSPLLEWILPLLN